MPITFRHDAAAVALPSNQAQRKYGQQLVLQQNQQKYQAQQAGYDRLFQLGRDVQENQNQFARDIRQNFFAGVQQREQNNFVLGRDKAQAEQQQQQQEAARQQAFLADARKQSAGMIMADIQNGEYDPVTARKLQQNLVAESEALGNPGLDATQRAEALAKIRAERALLSSNRLQKPPPPTAQEQFDKGIVTDPNTGMRYRQNAKGDFEQLEQPQQRPSSAAEAFAADPKLRDKYMEDAIAMTAEKDEFGKDKPLDRAKRKEAATLAQQLWEDDNLPTAAPELAVDGAPAARGPSQSILETPTAARPDAGSPPAPGGTPMMAQSPDQGMPPAPTGAPTLAQRPDAGLPPAPAQAPTMAARPDAGKPPAPPQPQQVKVGGKPLVVTPGTLTPQETAARQQIMQMPREERIAMLMPYDPELKGRTIDEILEDPKSKAFYEEISKEGLTTGNYREDMLAQMDAQLQHNVLNRAGTPAPAYVGMNINDIKDPKAKAELSKLPQPKTEDEIKTIRGTFFIDPRGIIRSTQKQA